MSDHNTCMMETNCKAQAEAIKEYDFGLTCIEANGKSSRHLFGTNSFDPVEKFDTLIDCKLCLGLDTAKVPTKASLASAVGKLKTEVEELSKDFSEVKKDIKDLNAKVFPKKGGAPAPAAQSLVIHKSTEEQTHK